APTTVTWPWANTPAAPATAHSMSAVTTNVHHLLLRLAIRASPFSVPFPGGSAGLSPGTAAPAGYPGPAAARPRRAAQRTGPDPTHRAPVVASQGKFAQAGSKSCPGAVHARARRNTLVRCNARA